MWHILIITTHLYKKVLLLKCVAIHFTKKHQKNLLGVIDLKDAYDSENARFSIKK